MMQQTPTKTIEEFAAKIFRLCFGTGEARLKVLTIFFFVFAPTTTSSEQIRHTKNLNMLIVVATHTDKDRKVIRRTSEKYDFYNI